MCGIAGLISEKVLDQAFRYHLIYRWRTLLNHRGPDNFGWCYCPDSPVLLFNSRLAITGVNNGFQPLPNAQKTIWLVFNGELYGYQQLRHALESEGQLFRTESDTEVVIHLYEKYGMAALQQLRGEFSFALYDSNIQKLFLVRDRFGIKPLYYAQLSGKQFYFASEIKGIFADDQFPRQFAYHSLRNYANTFFFETETPFEKVKQVAPGHYFCYDLESGMLQQHCYWRLPLGAPKSSRKERDLIEEFRYLLEDAIKVRIPAEVKYGAYLSGGLDSSAIASLMQLYSQRPFPVFSIGFKQKLYDESFLAKQLAKKLRLSHHTLIFGKGSLKEAFIQSIWHSEIPVSNTHGAAKLLLAKEAKKHCKVILTGEGADELLLGYDLFSHLKSVENKTTSKGFKKVSVLGGALAGKLKNHQEVIHAFGAYPYTMQRYFYLKKIARWLQSADIKSSPWDWETEIPRHIPLHTMKGLNSTELSQHFLLHSDFPSYILNYLGDRQEMSAGLEGRLPFLDHHLAEFLCTVPERLKLHNGQGKYILREAIKDRLPIAVVHRPKKVFYAPAFDSIKFNNDSEFFQPFTNKSTFAEVSVYNPWFFKALIRLTAHLPKTHPLLPVAETIAINILSLHILYDLYIRNFPKWRDRFGSQIDHSDLTLNDANHWYNW